MPSVGLKFYEWLNVESAVSEKACCFVNTLRSKGMIVVFFAVCLCGVFCGDFCESKQKSFRLGVVLRIFIEMVLPLAWKGRVKNEYMKIMG